MHLWTSVVDIALAETLPALLFLWFLRVIVALCPDFELLSTISDRHCRRQVLLKAINVPRTGGVDVSAEIDVARERLWDTVVNIEACKFTVLNPPATEVCRHCELLTVCKEDGTIAAGLLDLHAR